MAGSYKIDIETSALRTTATKIGTINENLDEKLMEINKAMDALENDWLSEASTEIRAAMNGLKPRFATYKSIVESYKKFLESTAESYESTESSIKTNASMFK